MAVVRTLADILEKRRKVGWVSMIEQTVGKLYCCVPPHEDIVSQYAEKVGCYPYKPRGIPHLGIALKGYLACTPL